MVELVTVSIKGHVQFSDFKNDVKAHFCCNYVILCEPIGYNTRIGTVEVEWGTPVDQVFSIYFA